MQKLWVAVAALLGTAAVATPFALTQGTGSVDVLVGSTPTATATPTPDPSTFNLATFPGANGSTCDSTPTRESTPFAAGDAPLSATACTFDQAYDAASCEDRVEVLGGTYAGQTTSGSRTCSGWTETDCSGCVKFIEAEGETAHLTSGLVTNADWSEYSDLSSDDDWEITASNVDHVMLRDYDSDSGVYFNGNCGIQYISMIGGDVGPQTNNHPQLAPGAGCGATWMQDVLFQGVWFHDIDCTDCGAFHVECMQSVGGTRITFRANKFTNCSIFGISITEYNGSGVPTDYLVENNWFGPINDGGSYGFQVNSNADSVEGLIYRYNSGTVTSLFSNGSPVNDALVYGNYQPLPDCSFSGGTGSSFANNVWSGGTCDASDTTDASLDFVNTTSAALDLHITNGSGAEANGHTTCIDTDYDGEARPQPSATTCDAGADERD